MVTQGFKMVKANVTQPLWHLENIGLDKRMGQLGTGANGMNTRLQNRTQNISKCNTILQQIRPTSPSCQTKNSWRSIWILLKLIAWLMKFLVWSHICRQIITFHMMKLIEYFDGNVIHFTEVKHSTYDEYEQLK